MKKVINLVPPSVKHERNIKKAKQSMVYVALACAGTTGGLKLYQGHLETQISDYQLKIDDYTTLETQVADLQEKIDETIEMKNSISSSSFPYHRFLYFLTVNATDDMRILSVESIAPESENVESDSTNLSVPDPNATNQAQQPTDVAPTEGQSPEQPANTTAENTQENPSGAMLETPENQTNATNTGNTPEANLDGTVELEQEAATSPFNFETSEVIIRGYSIYPDSIAILANKLKEEDYIETVHVTKVRDYYTGRKNFKLFEIKVTYQ